MKVVVLAGTSSGVGKTSLSVGLMRALRKRGLVVQAFKVGPDFLDPMHHEEATGRPSVNLDGWMLEREQNIVSFHRAMAGADIAVVEGVMGLFDGRDGRTEVGSTAEMAKWLGAPVVLVVDCWAMARSAAAMVKGYQEFDAELLLGGVLFNKVGGEAHSQWLREALEAAGSTAQVLGGIPKDDAVVLKERHLGLHMPGERDIPGGYMDRLASLLEKHVDLDKVLEVAAQAAVPEPSVAITRTPQPHRTRIAVARDAAFCFYYVENLMLLREAGAELVFFSPLSGSFPSGISGLYLGGGYPEMHAAELSAERSMRAAIKAFAEAGGVVYAECGGLLYLSQSIQPLHELPAPMVGVFPFRTHMTQNSMKMGYVEVRTQQPCALFPTASTGRGHVYHFSEILQERVVGGFANGAVICAGSGGEGWDAGYSATLQTPGAEPVDEGFTWRNVLASYVHLHFGSNPALAAALVDRCCQVDVQGANSAAAEAAARTSTLDAVPPLPRLSAVQSSPNLAALNSRKAAIARARSVDMGNNGPVDDEESYRRADAARSMSMDASSLPIGSPANDSVHIKAYGGTGTSGTCSPSFSSNPSSPTRSQNSLSPYRSSPFGSTTHAVHTGPHSPTQTLDTHDATHPLDHCNGHAPSHEVSRDGSRQASTSGQDDYDMRRHSSVVSMAGPRSHRAGSLESQPHSDAIVSLLPSATEILFALGLDKRVAGVTDLCDYPDEAHSRPKVSRSSIDTSRMSMEQVEASMQEFKAEGRSLFEIDAAWLARQPPGLLLTQDTCQACDPSTTFVTEALNQAGLLGEHSPTHVMELNPRTLSDVMDSILQVGAVAGAYPEAQRLVDKLRARLRAVASIVAKQPHRQRVLSLEGLKPLALGGLWLPEMKELAGGDYEWQQGGDPPLRITWDQVREYDPEVLILSPCSCNPSRALSDVCDLAGQPGWWALPAVKSGQVYIMDHAYFSRPGPRLADGVEMLARVLHPEVVSQRCPEGSVLKLSLRGGQRCRQRLLHNYFLPFQ